MHQFLLVVQRRTGLVKFLPAVGIVAQILYSQTGTCTPFEGVYVG